jgi:hypothetical protein
MAVMFFKSLQCAFLHHIDIQVKILKLCPYRYVSKNLTQYEHDNENYIANYIQIGPFNHAQLNDLKFIGFQLHE